MRRLVLLAVFSAVFACTTADAATSASVAADKAIDDGCGHRTEDDGLIASCTKAFDANGAASKEKRVATLRSLAIAHYTRENFDASIAAFTTAAQLEGPKDSCHTLFERGSSFAIRGDLARAVEDLNVSLRGGCSADANIQSRARFLLAMGNAKAAIADWDRGLRESRDREMKAPWYAGRAEARARSGDLDGASKDIETAIAASKERVWDAFLYRAYVLALRNRFADAKVELEKAKLSENHAFVGDDAIELPYRLYRGEVLLLAGEARAAMSDFDAVLQRMPPLVDWIGSNGRDALDRHYARVGREKAQRAISSAPAVALPTVAPAAGTFAASFDCRFATTGTESIICNSAELREADARLSRAFAQALAVASAAEATRLQEGQRAWIADRNSCGLGPSCISDKYRTRLSALLTPASPGIAPVVTASPPVAPASVASAPAISVAPSAVSPTIPTGPKLPLAPKLRRVALVIGNGAYDSVVRLPNPVRDAKAIAGMFRTAGFDDVTSATDASVAAMKKALRDFSERALDADMAVVFYAGHGIEVGGRNFLVPVDAKLARDIDVEDETVPLDRVLQLMEPVRQLKLVILDACRDNPFAAGMRRTVATRSIGRGLARPDMADSDVLIAYAAAPNATATDGDGANSPFTAALLKHLTTPGLDIRQALGAVRDDVRTATNRSQQPFISGSLGGGLLTLVPLGRDAKR